MLRGTSAILAVLLGVATAHGQHALTPKSRLAGCAEKACSVVIYGDSFTICDYANCRGVGPVTSTNRWAEQVRIALQRKYGSGGTGIVPVNVGYVLAAGTFNTLNAEAWSCTGTYDFNTESLHLGPSEPVLHQNAVLHMGAGATCRFHDNRNIAWGGPRGTLNTYYVTTDSSGTLTASVDNGAPVAAEANPTLKPIADVSQIPVRNSGFHTVVYHSAGDSYIYGAEGTSGTPGIRVHNLAMSGSNSTSVNSEEKLVFSNLIPSGVQQVIIDHYTNDVSGRTSTYSKNILAVIAAVQVSRRPPAILFVISPVSSMYPAGAQLPYTAEALAVCHSAAIACVNIQDHWGTAYNNAELRWDGVHPDDKGNLEEAAIIYSKLQ